MPRKKTMGRGTNGDGSIRKKTVKKNGKEYTYWEGRYTVGFDPGTGKQVQRSVTGKTQKEVAQKIKQLTMDLDNGVYQEPSKMTVSEWMDIWTAEYMGDKKYMTVKQYKAQVEAHIKPGIGAMKLSQLTPPLIQKFYNGLLDHGSSVLKRDKHGKVIKKDGKPVREPAPMAPKSVRNVHGILAKALSVAVGIGYLKVNPTDNVTLPRVEKKEIHPLTDEQVKAFLDAASQDAYGIALKVILFTGLRESEALGLTWDCVDFHSGTVKICKQLQKRRIEDGGTTLSSTKSGKTRVIKPAPFVMELLAKQYSNQNRWRMNAKDRWQEDIGADLVFTTPEGKHVSQTSIRYHFKKVVEAIGLPGSRVHDLRHTFAVLSLQNGDDIKTVQGNMGHATAAFTLDVYGHVSERMKDDSAKRMQAYIDSIQETPGLGA